nr:hypothetical protein [Ramlibacter cellulosilyticus]
MRRHRPLWLHGWCIGLVVLASMWGASHLQMVLGSDSLALRYAVTLGVGYLAFLCVLRWWAGRLVGERGSGGDVPDPADFVDLPQGSSGCGSVDGTPAFESGGGGDFGGGGASASFDMPSDTASAAGDLATGALEAAGSADEGAIVVVPVVVVFLAGLAVLFGVGSLLLLYFGSEVLLAVAVELAFGYVSARTAVRMAREGWLTAAVRLTWKPLLGALVCAVIVGALLDRFVPEAKSLPQAVKVMRGR